MDWPRVIVLAADETRDCSSAPVTLYVVSANLVLKERRGCLFLLNERDKIGCY